MGILSIYQHILVTMALFIFIVNQANILYDTFHIAFIRRRVIKKMEESLPMSIDVTAEKQAKELTKWEWPDWCYTFNWWMVPIVITTLTVSAIISYIFFGYNPNPMR